VVGQSLGTPITAYVTEIDSSGNLLRSTYVNPRDILAGVAPPPIKSNAYASFFNSVVVAPGKQGGKIIVAGGIDGLNSNDPSTFQQAAAAGGLSEDFKTLVSAYAEKATPEPFPAGAFDSFSSVTVDSQGEYTFVTGRINGNQVVLVFDASNNLVKKIVALPGINLGIQASYLGNQPLSYTVVGAIDRPDGSTDVSVTRSLVGTLTSGPLSKYAPGHNYGVFDPDLKPEPVSLTGALFDSFEDMNLHSPIPLTFTRYYSSTLTSEGQVTSALGTNWMHNFDFSLVKRRMVASRAFATETEIRSP
jgi:Domain of unknown function (DUF6531)